MYRRFILILFLTITGLLVFSYFNPWNGIPSINQFPKQNQSILSINGTNIKVEIADEPNEQSQGLSGRESLANDSGMLFVFPQPIITGFWMKDMKFSLDLIWIDERGKIIEITKNISPVTYPETFLPPSPIKYVLEVNAGWSDKNNIKIGDKITRT
ncbi:MAG: DUF192 domain-containing protein [Candidatus Yanofskybacteria bacterium]|nr:DUF192 domain-containing protein [Candidatus Yanofskybacteria bacterium]